MTQKFGNPRVLLALGLLLALVGAGLGQNTESRTKNAVGQVLRIGSKSLTGSSNLGTARPLKQQGDTSAVAAGISSIALSNIQVSAADDRTLVFSIAVDSVRRSLSPARPEYSALDFAQGIGLKQTGEPDIPYRRVVVGIPQTGAISVAGQGRQEEQIADIQVMPVLSWHNETPVWDFGPAYDQDAFYPKDLVKIENVGMMRDVRVATLLIAPVQYNPVRHECRIYHQVDVRVQFAEPAKEAGNPKLEARSSSVWKGIYEDLLPNGLRAAGWSVLPDSQPVRNFFDRSQVWYRMKIETTGVYRISYHDLKQAGANPDLIDPRTLQVFTLGDHVINQAQDSMIEVPALISGQSDSIWGKDGNLTFYARGSSYWDDGFMSYTHNLFTNYDYYWLTWGAGPGLRMSDSARAPNGAPQVIDASLCLRAEQDLVCPARGGLLWLWNEQDKSDGQDSAPADYSIPLRLPFRLDSLTLSFYSLNPSSDYRFVTNHLHIFFNGTLLDSVQFGVNGPGNPYTVSYGADRLAGLALNDDSNKLTIALVKRDSQRTIFFDYADVRYQRRLSLKQGECEFVLPAGASSEPAIADVASTPLLLDITHWAAPVQLTDFTNQSKELRFGHPGSGSAVYLAVTPDRMRAPLELVRRTPGHLKSDNSSSDYIIVVPDNMYDVAQLLQHYRTGNVPGIPNARVATAKLSEIYDEFSFGLEEPGAIKAFLTLQRPSYVLLVGDATYDYRDNLLLHPPPGVPPYEVGADLDPNVYGDNALAIDSWYADWDPTSYDTPDMILGRITVRSPEEFRHYYDKLVAYEHGRFGLWNRRLLLLADDEILGDWNGDNRDPLADDHIPSCEDMARLAGSRMDDVKVYETEYKLEALRDKPGVRKELIRQLADGVLIWIFFGHGNGFQLTHEHALSIEDMPLIQNGRKLPFCFFGSCGVGRWEDTRSECIAEELARKDDGAIATCGATKGTEPHSNEWFCAQMLGMILRGDSSLGRAFYSASFSGDKLYGLLGEPGLTLQFPRADSPASVVPETLRTGQSLDYSARLPPASGSYAATGFTDQFLRHYHSKWLDTTYILPGNEFFRGYGPINDHFLNGAAMIPNRIVGAHASPLNDGTYTPIPGTSRISIVGWDQEHCYSGLRDSLYLLTDTSAHTDHSGPEISILANGEPVYDGNYLPGTFQLSAQISDSSGILIAPVTQFTPSLYYATILPGTNTPPDRNSVADRFVYDFGSHTRGRFTSEVTLPAAEDTILVFAADNYLNTASKKVYVQVRVDSNVQIQQPLVYPNPTGGNCAFTFYLNRPASVTVKVFSLSGRALRTIPGRSCNLGFNQIAWDGRDLSGVLLPNGIYLYSIQAEALEGATGSSQGRTDQALDKFIVRR